MLVLNMSVESITLVSQVFYPDEQATSQLFTDLLVRLAEKGLKIRVVTGFTGRPSGRPSPKREVYQGVEIHRTGFQFDYKRGYIRRALHYLLFLCGGTIALWKLRHRTLVVAVTNPPVTPVWLWLLSKLFVKDYGLILLDVYPDGLVALGSVREGSLLARLWRWANRRALQNAKQVVVLGRDMAELVYQRYGVARERVIYIPHWSSFVADKIPPTEQTRLFLRLGLNGKFIVQYSGNMGLWHEMGIIVRAAALLRAHGDIHFLMIGGGMRKKEAVALAEELNLQNIAWLPLQEKESLVDSLCCSHVALISQREGTTGVAVPCKLYGILASGRALIAMVPKGSEIDRVIGEEQCGVALNAARPEDLADAILELSRNSERLHAFGKNAYAAYQTKYSIATAVERYMALWSDGIRSTAEQRE